MGRGGMKLHSERCTGTQGGEGISRSGRRRKSGESQQEAAQCGKVVNKSLIVKQHSERCMGKQGGEGTNSCGGHRVTLSGPINL